VLRDRADLEECAVACCHCGIRFLTHPRNKRRTDLRCPFGCRQHHRRQLANARSRKYSRTARGARNKKRLNGRRSQVVPEREPSPACCTALQVDTPLEAEAAAPACDPTREEVTLPLEGVVLEERTLRRTCTLPYLAMLISVLERAPIGRRDVLPLLLRAMRRRSMGRTARREYVLRFLHEHPPPGDPDEPIGGTNEP
jgi:hypothetical protein